MAITVGPAANTKQTVGGEQKTWDGAKWVPSRPPAVLAQTGTPAATVSVADGDLHFDHDTQLMYFRKAGKWEPVYAWVKPDAPDNQNPTFAHPTEGHVGIKWSADDQYGFAELSAYRKGQFRYSQFKLAPRGLLGFTSERTSGSFGSPMSGGGILLSLMYYSDAARRYRVEWAIALNWENNSRSYLSVNVTSAGNKVSESKGYFYERGQTQILHGDAMFGSHGDGRYRLRMNLGNAPGNYSTGTAWMYIEDVGS